MKLKMLAAVILSSLFAVSSSYADPSSADDITGGSLDMAQMDTNTNVVPGNPNDLTGQSNISSSTNQNAADVNTTDETGSADTATGDDDY